MTTEQPLALTKSEPALPVAEFHAFSSIVSFEQAQRMAKALCSSLIVPETFRGENRIGDCLIALEISNRIGANVLAVMQNLYVVHGKPAWSSQFLISCVNASRRFTPLRYRMTGTKGQDDWGCIAWAEDKGGEKLESPEVTIAMAKKEGWYSKNGSKWQSLPELMLRYRAATFFTRLYAPEITMGIVTREEMVDAVDVDSEVVPAKLPSFTPAVVESAPVEPEQPPVAPVAPAPKKRGPKAAAAQAAPVTPAEPAPPAPAPVEQPPAPEPSFEEIVDSDKTVTLPAELVALMAAIATGGVTETQVLKFCQGKRVRPPTMTGPDEKITHLSELTAKQMVQLTGILTAKDASKPETVYSQIKGVVL